MISVKHCKILVFLITLSLTKLFNLIKRLTLKINSNYLIITILKENPDKQLKLKLLFKVLKIISYVKLVFM